MPNHILITGGAGFIGSHLTEKLLSRGNFVTIVDNFFTGTKENIKEFLTNKHLRLINQNINNPLPLPPFDIIYHLACPASPPHYQAKPVETVKTNVLGSINILELAKKEKARVLLTSTSEIYGDPLIHPQPESYCGNVNPIGKRSCYDEGKRCAETLFFDYHREFGVDIRVARLFNTFGPKMTADDGRVITNFILQALKNKPITIYGNGHQTRSFMYIDDLIVGLIKFMNHKNFTGPLNLGNPQEITIKKLAIEIINQTHSKSKIIFRPLPEDDPKKRKPDISLAKNKIHWQPDIDWKVGLAKTIGYWRSRLT